MSTSLLSRNPQDNFALTPYPIVKCIENMDQAILAPIIQGGAILGILLALTSWALPPQHRSRYKLEIAATGFAFASVQFRFGIFFMEHIPDSFFILFLFSLCLLGPAVFLLTIRVLRVRYQFIRFYQWTVALILITVLFLDLFAFGPWSKPEIMRGAVLGKQENIYFWSLIVGSLFTISHYAASFGIFIYVRRELQLNFGRQVYWLLFGAVIAAMLVFVGFLKGNKYIIFPGALIFEMAVGGIILTQIRFPGMLVFIERKVQEAKYKKTGLENIDLQAVVVRLNQLMSEERVYRNPDLRLAELALKIGIHKNQLSRILNENFDSNFNEYLNKRRAEEAKTLLEISDLKVIEICHETGFNSLSAFTAVFKKTFGLSPQHFRKTRQS